MRNLADQVFDSFMQVSSIVHKLDVRRKIRGQIRDVIAERCGNCTQWMKTRECPRERRGEKQSMNAPGCKEFVLKSWAKKFSVELEAKLLEGATQK